MTEIQEDNGEIDADGKELSKSTRGKSKWRVTISLVIVSVLLIGAGSLYIYGEYIRRAGESNQSIEQFKSRIGLLQGRVATMEERLDELGSENASLLETLEEMVSQTLPANSALAMNEVEHLLIIASQRINIDGNITIALAAMREADKRLDSLHAPGLTEVRNQITEDINALRSVNEVDISGLSLYLADMAKRVDELELRNTAKDSDEAGGQNHIEEERVSIPVIGLIWQKVTKMVSIKRRSESMKTLPNEQYYIYQNLKLELLNARQAALNKDTANMRESIMLALDLLAQYFDGNQSATRNLIDSLRKMETLDMQPTIPDINSSLETVRAYIRYGESILDDSGDVPGPTP